MASFVVMEPPTRDRDPLFIRDGFHFLALLVPFVWLLVYRLWIEAAVVLAIGLLLGWVGTFPGFEAVPLLSILVSIFVGLEGAAMRIAALRRRGWREWGVVDADSRNDAELRYQDSEPSVVQAQDGSGLVPLPQSSSVPVHSGPALGLLSYPGHN